MRLFKLCEGAHFIALGVNEDVEAERWPEAIATAATTLAEYEVTMPFTDLMLRSK